MKPFNIIYVLFFVSLLLFTPFAKSNAEYDLVPQRKKDIVFKVHGIQVFVEITSIEENFARMEMNVSRLEGDGYNLIFFSNVTNEITVDLPKRGYYLFELLSPNLATVTIQDRFIPINTLIIFGVFAVAVTIVRLQQFFSVKIDY